MGRYLASLVALVAFAFLAACGGAASSSAADSKGTDGAESGESTTDGAAVTASSIAIGTFTAAGSMTDSRLDHVTLLLPDGRVFTAGGRTRPDSQWAPPALDSATVFEPATGKWADLAKMSERREVGSGHVLEDGRVLIIGGSPLREEKTTEIYDLTADTWTLGPRMGKRRMRHASVELEDGRLFIFGGTDTFHALVPEADIYDPAADTLVAAAPMSEGRAVFTATLLQDGRVLATGGGKKLGPFSNTAEIYDASSDTWSAAATMGTERGFHAATLLPDGRVLVTGGQGTDTVEIYDPATDAWTSAASMTQSSPPVLGGQRSSHTVTVMPDGLVLVTGGAGGGTSTEIFDPATGTWTAGASMTESRFAHSATLLGNGSVLLVGGQSVDDSGDRKISNTSEIYEP